MLKSFCFPPQGLHLFLLEFIKTPAFPAHPFCLLQVYTFVPATDENLTSVYLPGYQQGKPDLCRVVITLIFDYTNVFPENQIPILASLFAIMKPLPSQGKRISHFFSGKSHKIYLPRIILYVMFCTIWYHCTILKRQKLKSSYSWLSKNSFQYI